MAWLSLPTHPLKQKSYSMSTGITEKGICPYEGLNGACRHCQLFPELIMTYFAGAKRAARAPYIL